MTYQLVISRLKEIILAHKFINEYGYGDISDIAVPEDKERPDYPYAFINPVSTSLGQNSFTASFNLIVMTQVKDTEDDELFGQSNCMKYINDVLSQFVMTNNDPLLAVSFPVIMTPFKERFQDDVVGATANVTITYGKGMSVCDSPISGITPSVPYCPQVLVIDGDDTQHYLDAGDSYTCLPATPKSGTFYQRIIPWTNGDPGIDGSVYWHFTQGTYNYTPPTNPEYIACKRDTYEGSDDRSLLMQQNAFGNLFRFTNDRGQQYVEDFHTSGANISDNKQLCIDHLTGLAYYVQDFNTERVARNIGDAIGYTNTFSYAGISDWRLGDMSEYLEGTGTNDWRNAYNGVYAPMFDTGIRNVGGAIWTGSYSPDNEFLAIQSNGNVPNRIPSPTATSEFLFMVTNYYF